MEAFDLLTEIKTLKSEHNERSERFTKMTGEQKNFHYHQEEVMKNKMNALSYHSWESFDLDDIRFLAGLYCSHRALPLHTVLRKLSTL